MSELEELAARRMRMLRLGEGWSAEKLSAEYGSGGTGSLSRTTIAKIENNKRQIKVSEVEGVARVFGLTSNDLLDPNGPVVFVSYADKDEQVGRQVADWFRAFGFRVPATRDEAAIDAAQGFVALLSPCYQSSSQCQDELSLAVRREQQLGSVGSRTGFIHVLQIAETMTRQSSLQPYPAIDLDASNRWSKEVALSKVGLEIFAGPRGAARNTFLGRGEEVDRVLSGLASPAGPHFWLVISPPGFGKTSFLAQLARLASDAAPAPWTTTTLDLRRDAANTPRDPVGVIRALFGIDPQPSFSFEDELADVARRIIVDEQPRLYLLDSAELLSEGTVNELRKFIGIVYTQIQDQGSGNARLGLVAASRRDDGWRGARTYPEPSVLPLHEFVSGTVHDALETLAQGMPGFHPRKDIRDDAMLVTRVTEGVPWLVRESLDWIKTERWVGIDRLENQQLFNKIVSPFIKDQLLAPGSLSPKDEDPLKQEECRTAAVLDGLRVLSPYRFFTMFHIYDCYDNDPQFKQSLVNAGWEVDRLWEAISNSALLYQPLTGAWQEIHPAVRRLLFRHFYPIDQRADAHEKARDFSRKWALMLTGQDQIAGLVEAIWHEAARLRLSDVTMVERKLLSYTRGLSSDVIRKISQQSGRTPYSMVELREYAAQRMRDDDELQREIAEFEGLFDKLHQSFLPPEPKGE